MNISELIRTIRKEKGMTQQELADHVHLTVQAVNQYESGKREIKAEMLVSLLKALGYDFSIQETFEDRTVFALEWDLSFYDDYDNEYGMIYTDFRGAKELTKETYETLQALLTAKQYPQAAELLSDETKHLPHEGDRWDAESWEQFFEEASLDKTNPHIHFKTTKPLEADDQEEYDFGSFLTLKTCLLSEIKDKECVFNRMVFD